MQKNYDILFIYAFSRVHPYLLTMIKYLGKKAKIGICVFDAETFNTDGGKRIAKLEQTEDLFLRMCADLGAEIIPIKGPFSPQTSYAARLLFIPQSRYNEEAYLVIKKYMKADGIIGLQTFGLGDRFLDDFVKVGCRQLYVYDKDIFLDLLKVQKREDLLSKLEIVEMGASYMDYPLWPKEEFPRIDYMIAFPTAIFLKDPGIKNRLIKNMYSFVRDLPEKEVVAIKLHNVRDGGNDYIPKTPVRSLTLASFAERYCGVRGMNFSSAVYYRRILDRAVSLAKLTPYYNLNLELLLPYVRKGVITGISSVLWHCRHNNIPVFNCDSQPFGPQLPNYEIYRHFYLPYHRDLAKFQQPRELEGRRQPAIIELIRKELSAYVSR